MTYYYTSMAILSVYHTGPSLATAYYAAMATGSLTYTVLSAAYRAVLYVRS